MTMIDEEQRALKAAERFLVSLLHPSQTPRVPLAIRKQAGDVLRHYPSRALIDYRYEEQFKEN